MITKKYTWKKRRKSGDGNIEGELVQSTLHTCMELSLRNPLILLVYANLKIK
jgi:hypothetical protein